MSILFRFVLKNLLEKRFRLFLLLFSLAMSSALFFVANGAASTVKSISGEIRRKYVGSADLVVEPNKRTPPFLRTDLARLHAEDLAYAIGVVEGEGLWRPAPSENVRVRLRGIELDDLLQMNQVRLEAEHQLRPFAGPKLIVGRPAATRYNLKVGDTLLVEVNGQQQRFLISAIAEPGGLFLDDGETTFMALPREQMAALTGAGQGVNALYLKLADPAAKERVMAALMDDYRNYTVREAVSQAELERDAHERTDPYKVIVVVLLFMGIFVIYSSFRVIAAERLSVIGTLRSVGATQGAASFILFGESLVCGVAGGLLGCLLGIGLLHLMLWLTLPSNLRSIDARVDYSWGQLAATFGLAVFVSLISSAVPILKTARLPIKNTIFGLAEEAKEQKPWKLVVGLLCVATTLAAPRIVPLHMALPVSLISVILPVVAAILAAPAITHLSVRLLERAYLFLFGNIGSIAVKNLRENASVLNNISLLVISISSFLVINTLSYSVASEVKDLFRNNALFDVVVWVRGEDPQIEKRIYKTPGVDGVMPTLAAFGVEAAGTGTGFAKLYGVPKANFFDYWELNLLDARPPAEVMEELDAGRNILVTNLMRDKLGLRIGDIVTLKLPRGDVPYRVIGFFQSYNAGGSFAMISDRFFKMDTQGDYWVQFGVKVSGDSEAVAAVLKKALKDRSLFVRTVDEDERINYEQFKTLFDMLKVFSGMILVISLFGVINNFLISFLQRKRSFAVLRSIGMSRSQIVRMLLIESATGGLVGSILGLVGGLLMISVMPVFMVAIEQVAPIHFSVGVLVASLAAGVSVSLLASTSPALRTSRLDIIQAIKYE